MRKYLISLSLAAFTVVFASTDLVACGDKYIRLAARLGPEYAAENAATVLIYMPPDSVVPAAARRHGLHDALRRAGHTVTAITREADLESALNARKYDLVIADAAHAQALESVLQRAPGRPTLVPMFHSGATREIASARQQGRCFIDAGKRAYYTVAEIDHAMELRKTRSALP